MAVSLSFEMSLDREALLRGLPAAVGPGARSAGPDACAGGEGERRWHLRFGPLPDLRMGGLTLARHLVEFRFEGFSEEEVAAFVARFHRAYRRGGG